MKLNKEQQKKLIKSLNSNWSPPKACSICGNNQWSVSSKIYELREFHGGSMVIGGQSSVTPVVSAICENCGHTLFFNAIKLNLVKRKNEQKKKKK